ncbi:hypothetical protein [Pseudofrankia sp. DC12]|uniref:hypothetical protein n=1 Tax=Pseudofrankia sp. DC12 TaxID=683315 RepID=UPI0005F80751|nr:hypothetical protein [Pseudofrankia sp. DC12]
MTIDEYLDELLARSKGPAAEVRRLLAETEAHLRDAAAAQVVAGLDGAARGQHPAAAAAISRYPPHDGRPAHLRVCRPPVAMSATSAGRRRAPRLRRETVPSAVRVAARAAGHRDGPATQVNRAGYFIPAT